MRRGVVLLVVVPVLVLLVASAAASGVARASARSEASARLDGAIVEQAAEVRARVQRVGSYVAGAAAHYGRRRIPLAAMTDEELESYIDDTGSGPLLARWTDGFVFVASLDDAVLEEEVRRRRRSAPSFALEPVGAGPEHAVVWAATTPDVPLGAVWSTDEARSAHLSQLVLERHRRILVSQPLVAPDGRTVVAVSSIVERAGGTSHLGWLTVTVDVGDLLTTSRSDLDGLTWTLGDDDVVLGSTATDVVSSMADVGGPVGDLQTREDVEAFGQLWVLLGSMDAPGPDRELLVAGLAIAVLLAALTLGALLVRRRLEAHVVVAERDRDRHATFARTVMRAVDVAIVAVDPQGNTVMENDASIRMFGEDFRGEDGSLPDVYDADGRLYELERLPMMRALRGEAVTDEEVCLEIRGERRIHLVNAAPLHDGDELTGAVTTAHDITDRKAVEHEFARLAMHDHLTGIPNRRKLHAELTTALHRQSGVDPGITLLFADLDGFKQVNDTVGHVRGDRMLVEVAELLTEHAHDGDVVARMGGDEFVVLCTHHACDGDAVVFARALADAVAPALEVGDGTDLRSGISIGVVHPEPDASVDDVLRQADLAMYDAKADDSTEIRVYETTLGERAAEALRIESELRSAIRDGDLDLHFQPILDATGRLASMEALVRWSNPDGTYLPGVFLPVAEKTGMMADIDLWVLRHATRAVADPAMADAVSVNVSAITLERTHFVDAVSDALDAAGLRPGQLTVELTETALVGASGDADRAFAALAELGVGVSLDDFGTGYASLTYLRRFPVNQIKIDRSFVAGMVETAEDHAIVASSIQLARALGVQVVAEGIETDAQHRALRALGCDRYQGFLFGRPLPAAEWRPDVGRLAA